MSCKLLVLLSLAASALFLTGCDNGRAEMGAKEAQVLGVAKYQSDNYGPTGPNTFAVSTDELYTRENYSGKKVTFLWGLVTLKDY
jgi:hypothetical protein